ncbi:AEC family transporter [Gayadomonas joobiniege]|uniref:AEC family transporter n=1 Tax=Gayadomonas joobiniege TaxID=1234606 RepID=UPI00035FE392|nr:AEC family transporter [Gayadomonas joobiniege]
MTAHFIAAINVSGPVLIILLLGIFFRRLNLLDGPFIASGNKLVFKVALPSLLFLSTAQGSIKENLNLPLIAYAVVTTLLSVLAVWLLYFRTQDSGKRAVLTQCAFRGNMGIVGLALCVNAFGQNILPHAAVYVAALTILYNLIAVVLLTGKGNGVLSNILKNPLIIAIVAGIAWSLSGVELPTLVSTSVGYLAKLTLPLALLCIGATLDWRSFKSNQAATSLNTLLKLIVLPGLITAGGFWLGFSGHDLGILFLMMASPTAAAAYIMSKQMTSHGQLAAEIVTLSTLLCPLSITLGLMLLSYLQLI